MHNWRNLGRLAGRSLLGLGLLSSAVPLSGCTRAFFRDRADKEAESIIAEKDVDPAWKVEHYHVEPNPLARFADTAGTPDCPPMPPDDPAASALAPNPQKPPHKAGVEYMEGQGYLHLLADWDRENRAAAGPARGPVKVRRAIPAVIPPTPYKDPLGSAPEKGFLLKLEQAVELGVINSREFQDRREDLYLTALPVTTERFAFGTQFFATEQLIRERLGRMFPGGPADRWVSNGQFGFTKLFSTGALLMFQFANRTVIELANPLRKHTISESTINLDLVQPLLRGGGRAVTLEPLTLVERNLLYEVRDYARFRKQFFVGIAAGAIEAGLSVGNIRFRGRPAQFLSRFLLPGADVSPSQSGVVGLPASGNAQASGYLPVVLNAALLENERQNVAELEGILELFRSQQEGGQLNQLQVQRVEQQLLQSRSRTFQRDQTLRDTLDRFKLQLGVPADLPLELDGEPLAAQRKLLRDFEVVLEEFDEVRLALDPTGRPPGGQAFTPIPPSALRARLEKEATTSKLVAGTEFRTTILRRWAAWRLPLTDRELAQKLDALGRRRNTLLDQKSEEYEEKGKEPPDELLRKIGDIESEIVLGRLEQSLRKYQAPRPAPVPRPAITPGLDPLGLIDAVLLAAAEGQRARAAEYRGVIDDFLSLLLDARRERVAKVRASWPTLPRLCVEGIDLLKEELSSAEAVVARTTVAYRLDLMNVRAQLVDAWRQIAVAANSLLGTFNVEYHLLSLTPPGEAKPLAFSGSRSRHQLVFNAELPLVRIIERNNYRASLINWQRQRRTLMASEDTAVAGVRSQVRQLRVLAENYRIQQRAVELAYLQVENSLDTFRAPPVPTGTGTGAGPAGPNVANDAALTQQLLEAQNNLVQAQNNLMTIWVQYLTTRMQLYRDLELLPLDPRGVWTDDVATCHCPPAAAPGPDRQRPGGEAAPAPRKVEGQKPLVPLW